MKKHFPNFLTLVRIFFIPFIFLAGMKNQVVELLLLAMVVAILDCLDGYFARKYQCVSKLGRNLDFWADRFMAFTLLVLLVIKRVSFLYLLIFDGVLVFFYILFVLKKRESPSLLVAKIKTWSLFITLVIGFTGLVIPFVSFLLPFFVSFTILLQLVTLLLFLWRFTAKEDVDKEEFLHLIDPIINEPEFQKRKEYPHHINESVYEHVLRVSYDCYKIGKRLKMDYKSLAIAGLLHDFYLKPWQYNPEKKPFLQKHAFTHAKEAVENSKKVFGKKVITKKVESIMITHMFPLNKKIPRSKEAWLLTLVDKADSIDFLLHPVILIRIFCHKK